MDILNTAYEYIKKNEEYKNVPFTKLTEELENKIGGKREEEGRKRKEEGGRREDEEKSREKEGRRREEGFCLKGFRIKDSKKRKRGEEEREEQGEEEGRRVFRKLKEY